MAAKSDLEHTAAENTIMHPTQLPFKRTRSRSYAAHLDSFAGDEYCVSLSVASAPLRWLDGQTEAALCMQARPTTNPGTSNEPPEQAAAAADPSVLQSALCEISALQTKLSGFETTVSLISNSHGPVGSRHSPSHGRRAQQATTACTSSTPADQARPHGAIATLNLSTHQLPVSAGKLVGSRPCSPYSAPVQAAVRAGGSQHAFSTGTAGPKSLSMHPTAAWLVSAAPAGRASAERQSRHTASPSASSTNNVDSANGPAEVDMQAEMKGPVGTPVHHSSAASTVAAEAASKYSSYSSSDIPGSTSVVPVTRDEAIQLERKLAKALPPGAMLSSQQQHLSSWHKQQEQQWKQQLAEHPSLLQQYQQIMCSQTKLQQLQLERHEGLPMCDALCPELTQQHHMIDKLLREAAQQVAYHCSEQGRAIDGLRERSAELANSMYLVVISLAQQSAALSRVSAAAAASTAAGKVKIRGLQRQLQDKSAQSGELQSALSVCQEKLEQLVVESDEDKKQAQHQISLLRQQLWQCQENLELKQAAAEKAAVAARDGLHAQEAAAEEARQELLQRLGFLNLQLKAIREQMKVAPDATDASMQTDVEPAVAAPAPEPQPQRSFSSISSVSSEEEDSARPCKKRKKAVDLLKYAKCGQQRSKLWLVKVIGQLYADKAIADAIADRAGQQRSSMTDFIFTWHLTRYGLKQLATEALSDLLASACHHAKANRAALWFARFCGVATANIQPELSNSSSEETRRSSGGRWQSTMIESHAPTSEQQQGSTGITPTIAGETEQQMLLQQQTAEAGSSSPGAACTSALPAAIPLQSPEAAVALPAANVDNELLLTTPAALDFYLFCCCQLAYPNSVIALFPEGEDATPLVRSSLVMESLKAIYRYLQDPEGQTAFISRRLDAAAVSCSSAACSSSLGTAATDGSGIATSATRAASASATASKPSKTPRSTTLEATGIHSSRSGFPITQQVQQQPLPLQLRAPAASGPDAAAGAASCRGSSSNNSSSGSGPSSASGILGGFGYYSAWVLLDLLMSEWLDRVLANGQSMVQLRRTITNMHPSLQQQVAAAAAAAEHRPNLLEKLCEAQSALDAQLNTTVASGQAAAGAAHSLDKSADPDDSDYSDAEREAEADASTGRYQLPLSQHWLIADAVGTDAAGAWKAYRAVVDQLQVVRMRVQRPVTPLLTAEAVSAQEFDSQPITADDVSSQLGQVSQQGIMLSEALQQQLQALGLDIASSCTGGTDAMSGAGSSKGLGPHNDSATSSIAGAVSSVTIQDVLMPGGVATALQLAKQRRAAAAAAANCIAIIGSHSSRQSIFRSSPEITDQQQ